MKKLIITSAILLFTAASYAQTKAPAKPQYQKVVQIPVEDYNALVSAVTDLKGASMYTPNLTADQKVQQYQSIEAYLKGLEKRVKFDSIKTTK
jgi:predicted enzyme involved in methoxymalonyl-ACP biosynthesis